MLSSSLGVAGRDGEATSLARVLILSTESKTSLLSECETVAELPWAADYRVGGSIGQGNGHRAPPPDHQSDYRAEESNKFNMAKSKLNSW
jgi:hypothetical protein